MLKELMLVLVLVACFFLSAKRFECCGLIRPQEKWQKLQVKMD
ncbi:hypothetical protein NC651_033882 [Populus alba x Populus x berolinensis]|nr:hypothetical protein NC651_033882 [Populus alba x Populus x berolinensis]